MSNTQSSQASRPIPEQQWRELCAQLRATDDVSFKLLGFVPLFTVAAIAAVLLKTDAKFSLALVLASFVGALSTLGFWIWERRNIQTCLWLRDRAADMERATYGSAYIGQFARFPVSIRGLGKTQGEKVVYATTLTAWLLVPLSALSLSTFSAAGITAAFYILGGIVIAFLGWRELSVPIKVVPRE